MSGPQPGQSWEDWGTRYRENSSSDISSVNTMTLPEALIWYHHHWFDVRPVEITPDGSRRLANLRGFHFDDLPRASDEEIAWLAESWNPAWQIGMILSKASRMWGIDADDMDQWARLTAAHNGQLTPTATQQTGRDGGGLQLVYWRPEEGRFGDADVLRQGSWSWEYPNIEVKSKGFFTVAPSVHHKTGRAYQWLSDHPQEPLEASEQLLASRGHAQLEERISVAQLEQHIQREARRREDAVEHAGALAAVPERPGQFLADFLAAAPEVIDFEIPQTIPKQSRVIFTGEEGAGKSTLWRYIAGCHAAGVHPFTGERYEGGVAVLLDCENPPGLMQMRSAELRDSLDAGAQARMRGRLVVDCQPGGIDLASPYWQEYVLRLVDRWDATLVCPGPLYKLCAAHKPMSEEFFGAVSEFLDRLRAQLGCSLGIEAHCRQPAAGQIGRDIFPYGNTGWRRWPETGMFLSKSGLLTDWRGNRYGTDVSWPLRLARVPGSQVLWRAEYAAAASGSGQDGGAVGAEKIRAIRAAVAETRDISLARLRVAVGDDGTWIRRAVERGAITEHKTGPGKANRYEVNQAWSGGPDEVPSFQRWWEMADTSWPGEVDG